MTSAREAHPHDAHVTLAPGYAEWREGARQALFDCRRILDAPETFGRHLDRRQRQQNQQKLDQQKQESQKAKTRDRGGLSM